MFEAVHGSIEFGFCASPRVEQRFLWAALGESGRRVNLGVFEGSGNLVRLPDGRSEVLLRSEQDGEGDRGRLLDPVGRSQDQAKECSRLYRCTGRVGAGPQSGGGLPGLGL